MLYRFKIKPESPVITPLMSDTFFGHFCWALLYAEGENFLEKFLQSFGNGQTAPVLFSSAFPEGCLPRPALSPCPRRFISELVQKYYGEDTASFFKGMSDVKQFSKNPFISLDHWQTLSGNYSEAGLMELFIKEKDVPAKDGPFSEVSACNVINRITGKVPETGGGLFSREKTWMPKNAALDLYVEVNDSEVWKHLEWFLIEYLPANGFGADKSVGMGCLKIHRDMGFDPDLLTVKSPNAGLCLSLTAFPGMGEYTAYYRLKTKFGRLGGDFAVTSPTGVQTRPFKKPIIMYETGAVILGETTFSQQPLLSDVHSDQRIRHCGIPVILPFHIDEGGNYDSQAPHALPG